MTRLEQLREFVKEEPHDPFNSYALALELLNSSPEESLTIFSQLISAHRDYLPTYYPYAQLLAEQKQNELAEKIFTQGIEVAKANKDMKALKEIQNAYQDWQYGV